MQHCKIFLVFNIAPTIDDRVLLLDLPSDVKKLRKRSRNQVDALADPIYQELLQDLEVVKNLMCHKLLSAPNLNPDEYRIQNEFNLR